MQDHIYNSIYIYLYIGRYLCMAHVKMFRKKKMKLKDKFCDRIFVCLMVEYHMMTNYRNCALITKD